MLNKTLCAIALMFALNAHAAEKIKPELIIESYTERLKLISNAAGSYTIIRELSGPASALYEKQKKENDVSKMWELMDILPCETIVDFAYTPDGSYTHVVYTPDPERKDPPGDTESYCAGDSLIIRDNVRNRTTTKKMKKTSPIIDGHNPLFMGMMYYTNDYNVNYSQLVTEDGIGVPPNLYQVNYYENKEEIFSEETIDGRSYAKITATDRYFNKTKEYCIAWLDPDRGYLVRKLEVRGKEKNELKHTFETTAFRNFNVSGRNIWIVEKAVIKEFYFDCLVENEVAPLSEITFELKNITFGDGDKKIKRITQ